MSFLNAGDFQQDSDDTDQTNHVQLLTQDLDFGQKDLDVRGVCGVVVAENDVANGFVKDGSSLPYIFETNESGNRKRSSKILPVCGMCGKKFVCVTTMKRHLVTHTGEKPFSCKVCGKQYTQKGNLRVHERTHRNDRPFECNICHQKFYRKEPMQKHQWRQHGIVHFKSRPNNTSANNNINNNNTQPALSIIGAEGILYNALNESISDGINGGISQPELHFEEIPVSYVVETTFPVSQAVFLDPEEPSDQPQHLPVQPQPLEQCQLFDETEEVPEAFEETIVHTTDIFEVEDDHKPMKLKMKLAQAYMKEVEEIREREEQHERDRDGRGDSAPAYRLDHNLSDIRLSGSDSNSTSNPDSRPLSRAPEPPLELRTTVLEHKEASQDPTEKESLEFTCKSCGTMCSVSDPYSFRCPTCSMKYTSLPTHMIADPLQCIGCMEIFLHKPALKQHQSSEDKERPFRCCKCGFEFRQKAHLQKHQWRIHRKKYETDPSVREAEALLSVVDQLSTRTREDTAERTEARETISAETIVEDVVRSEVDQTPLDLSPVKMYGTAGSITKWVEQVETARTPIIPDISIHKKAGQAEPMSRFKELLSRPTTLTQQKEQVQLHIINSLSGRREESLTIRLLNNSRTSEQKPFAVKSKPPHTPQVPDPAWKNVEQADNPLINQVNVAESPAEVSPGALSIDRASKRPRTDMRSELPPQAADLSFKTRDGPDTHEPRLQPDSLEARLRTPLMLNTTPLRLDTPYSTVSPPLNLSNAPQVSPYDYRIKNSNLISGHFHRLKSQDDRSGI